MTDIELNQTIRELLSLRDSSANDAQLCRKIDTLIECFGFGLCFCDFFNNSFSKDRD